VTSNFAASFFHAVRLSTVAGVPSGPWKNTMSGSGARASAPRAPMRHAYRGEPSASRVSRISSPRHAGRPSVRRSSRSASPCLATHVPVTGLRSFVGPAGTAGALAGLPASFARASAAASAASAPAS
jgi:hypothetical protein